MQGLNPNGFGVLGMGMYLPARVIENEHFAHTANTTVEWIAEKTGVLERRRVADGETTADLGAEAARHALKDAERLMRTAKGAAAPEMLVVATSSPDRQVPAPVFDVHSRLGLHRLPALSLDGACAGFAQSMITAYSYFRTGLVENALIVGAHRCTFAMDESDKRIAPLFGDGGGAFLMGEVPAGYGIIGFEMITDSVHAEAVTTPMRGDTPGNQEYLEIDGHALVEIFSREMPTLLVNALGQAGLDLGDVDHFILHQANVRMVEGFAAAIGATPDRVPTSGRVVGNTVTASLPIGAVMANEDKPFQRDDILVFATAGAGVSGAVVVLRWY